MNTSNRVFLNTQADPDRDASQNVATCTRCAGLLIREGLFDLFSETGDRHQWAWRCVQCGNIVDALILKHRTCANPSTRNVMGRRRWTGVQALTGKPVR